MPPLLAQVSSTTTTATTRSLQWGSGLSRQQQQQQLASNEADWRTHRHTPGNVFLSFDTTPCRGSRHRPMTYLKPTLTMKVGVVEKAGHFHAFQGRTALSCKFRRGRRAGKGGGGTRVCVVTYAYLLQALLR